MNKDIFNFERNNFFRINNAYLTSWVYTYPVESNWNMSGTRIWIFITNDSLSEKMISGKMIQYQGKDSQLLSE